MNPTEAEPERLQTCALELHIMVDASSSRDMSVLSHYAYLGFAFHPNNPENALLSSPVSNTSFSTPSLIPCPLLSLIHEKTASLFFFPLTSFHYQNTTVIASYA